MVHPLREDAAPELLEPTGSARAVLDRLVAEGRIRRAGYGGHAFH
jgi:hypothetical protein